MPPLVASATVAPGRPLLPYGQFTLSPEGGTKEFHLFLSSCLPLGEGAERSEAEGGCAPQLNIVPVSSNFPVPKGHNANFVWNQDEASVKFVR